MAEDGVSRGLKDCDLINPVEGYDLKGWSTSYGITRTRLADFVRMPLDLPERAGEAVEWLNHGER